MSGEGALHAMAEVGVALAGFAALVALFRRGGISWTPAALSALRFMIELSLFIVVFALLPTPLALSGLPPRTVWCAASGCALLVGVVLFAINVGRIRDLRRTGWKPPTWRFHVVGFTVGLAILAGFAANLWLRGPAIYLAGLIGAIFLVGLQFLAFSATRGAADTEPS